MGSVFVVGSADKVTPTDIDRSMATVKEPNSDPVYSLAAVKYSITEPKLAMIEYANESDVPEEFADFDRLTQSEAAALVRTKDWNILYG